MTLHMETSLFFFNNIYFNQEIKLPYENLFIKKTI